MRAMLTITALVSAVFLLFLYGTGDEVSEAPPKSSQGPPVAEGLSEVCSGSVLETMSSGGYTYVRVDCGGSELWAAGPQTQVALGDRVSLPHGQEMTDFHSATLERTFETILFVPSIHRSGATESMSLADAHQGGVPVAGPVEVDLSGIERPAGTKTIEEIFANRSELAGTEVSVLAKVVKYNAMIMGKNWIHLQDGTGEAGSNDLTVTTQATASVGDTVLVRGTVGLDIDVGAGYRYDVLVEDATLTIP